MPDKIFFQSSLPRVGSTVFQNLMNQDPRFYASSTSGMLELIYAARHNYTESLEFKAQDPELMKQAFFGFCRRVYDYLGIPPYQNDFNNIPQTTKEDDEVYGFAGLHTIRPSLEMRPSDAKQILGKDVYDWIMKNYQWYNDYFGYQS